MTKKERSRKKIMHAAKGLYEQRGFENVTFQDIADAAEVCRSTVFNHFAGSADLMTAIFEQEMTDIEEYCRTAGLDGRARIEAVFDKLIEDTACYPLLTYRLISNAVLNCTAGPAGSLQRMERLLEEALPEEFRQRQGREQTAVIAVMGAYYGLVNHYHSLNKAFDAELMKAEFHRLMTFIFGGREHEELWNQQMG